MANKGNFKIKLLSTLIIIYFTIKRLYWRSVTANYKDRKPCLIALWHAHQLAFYGVPNRHEITPLISKSNDGQLITNIAKHFGVTALRGSQGRGGTQATLQILETLESGGKVAITIDGPKGPNHVAKQGIVKMAQLSQVPVVPMVWYSNSKNWVALPSWDGFRFPFFFLKSLILFGEPIYVPNELTDEEMETYRLKIENAIKDLYADAQQNFDKYIKDKRNIKSKWKWN